MGELHMEIIAEKLKKEYKVKADLGPIQISYRETLVPNQTHKFHHKYQREAKTAKGSENMYAELTAQVSDVPQSENIVEIDLSGVDESQLPSG